MENGAVALTIVLVLATATFFLGRFYRPREDEVWKAGYEAGAARAFRTTLRAAMQTNQPDDRFTATVRLPGRRTPSPRPRRPVALTRTPRETGPLDEDTTVVLFQRRPAA